MPANRLKRRLVANEPSFVFSIRSFRTVDVLWLATAIGYHGVYVDLQHSTIGLETASRICQAALSTEMTAFVRPPGLEPGLIGRLLDAGAAGILAPDVRSPEEARRLVEAALLEPKGRRSFAAGIPDPRIAGLPADAAADAINAATLLIAMIESPEAVEAAGEIAAVDGIDAIQIGSNDLTIAMGIRGQFGHERMRAACRGVIAACRAAGKPLVIGGMRKREDVEPYVRMGAARCYFTGSDTGFMLDGARTAFERAAALDRSLDEDA